MGVGEMSSAEFTAFLEQTLGPAAERCRDGAIAFVCMDWRHADELTAAGKVVFTELKNLCVWNKSNAGMGSLYRSKHELVFVFKKGTAPHVNSFGLGEDRASPKQRLGLPRDQQHRTESGGGTRDASDRQANEAGR